MFQTHPWKGSNPHGCGPWGRGLGSAEGMLDLRVSEDFSNLLKDFVPPSQLPG